MLTPHRNGEVFPLLHFSSVTVTNFYSSFEWRADTFSYMSHKLKVRAGKEVQWSLSIERCPKPFCAWPLQSSLESTYCSLCSRCRIRAHINCPNLESCKVEQGSFEQSFLAFTGAGHTRRARTEASMRVGIIDLEGS